MALSPRDFFASGTQGAPLSYSSFFEELNASRAGLTFPWTPKNGSSILDPSPRINVAGPLDHNHMDLNLASRSYGSNENSPLVSGSVSPKRWIPPSSQPTQSKRRKSIGSTPSFRSLDTSAKLDHIFDVLEDLEWSLGDLLHHLFVWRVDSKRIPFSKRHAAYVQRYLGGDSNSSVSEVLEAWLTTPYGRPRTDNDSADMFSTRKDYRDINVARPAVTSFAAQIVKSRLQEEAQQATRKSTGLYAPIRQKNINANITWKDLGSSSLAIVKTELEKYQPLTLSYMQAVAQGSPRKRNGVTVVRCRNRPTELVGYLVLVMRTYLSNCC